MLPASDSPHRAPAVQHRLPQRLVDLLRLRQRAAQDPGLVTGMEPAGDVRVDRREEALAAAARPVPEGQGGPLEHLPGEHVERGGVAAADGLPRHPDTGEGEDPSLEIPPVLRPAAPGLLDRLNRPSHLLREPQRTSRILLAVSSSIGGRSRGGRRPGRPPLLGPVEDVLDRPGVPLQGVDDPALDHPLRPRLPRPSCRTRR